MWSQSSGVVKSNDRVPFCSNNDSCILLAMARKVEGSPWTFFPSAPELISCLQNASSSHLVQTYTLHSRLYKTRYLPNFVCGRKVYPCRTSMHWKAEGLLCWKESEGAGSNQYLMPGSDSQPLKQLSHGNAQKALFACFQMFTEQAHKARQMQ